MEFRFEGYIREIGPLETITINNNDTNKRDIIVSTDEEYPKSLVITFWENQAKEIGNAVPMQYISVDYKCKATIGKNADGVTFFRNNIRAWRFQLGQVNPNLRFADKTIPAYQQPPQAAPLQAAPAQQVAAPQVATIPGCQQAAPQQQVAAPAQQVAAPQVAMQVNGLPNPVMLNQGQAPF